MKSTRLLIFVSMLWFCCDCQGHFDSLRALKIHAGGNGIAHGRPVSTHDGGCSGRYYKREADERMDEDTIAAHMDGDLGADDALDEDLEVQPGYVYHQGKRVSFAEHADNLELTHVEYTIARAALKLPAKLGATVVQFVRFMRYTKFHL